jgi:hypothetical protein
LNKPRLTLPSSRAFYFVKNQHGRRASNSGFVFLVVCCRAPMAVPGSPLLAAGIHPKIASERLGHLKVGITLDLYSHVLPGLQDEAGARVDDMIRAA